MGIIDEHAPRDLMEDSDYDGEMYNPSDEDRKAIKEVDKFFSKAKKWRSNYDKDWIDNYKFFRGQQWKEQRPSYRHSEVINMVFQTIQSFVPVITDNRPKFEFLPQDPTDQEFASIVNDVCESDWEKNGWLFKVSELIYDTHIYGIGYLSMNYIKNQETTLGDLELTTEDPMYCYPDPNCQDINDKNCRGFLIAEPVDVEILKSQYENGRYVKGDLDDLSNYDKTDVDGYAKLRLPIDSTKVMRETSGSVDNLNIQKALKKTYYMYDRDYDENEKQNPDGSLYYEQVKKYPKGRKIVVAGNVLLEDGPLEYEDGKIPVARCINYILPREFFGISEVEQIRGPQRIFNKLVSFSLDVLTLMGNPVWVVGTDSGVDTENLFNKPGLIIEKNPGSEVTRQEGVQLQPYVLQLIDRMRDWFDGLTGATDVSRGVTPGGVTAAAAISDLQEAAQTRIRLKSRNLDDTLQKIGQMWLSRTLQFRDAPEMVRVTGNDGAQKYFKFHVQTPMDEMGQPIMNDQGMPSKQMVLQEYNQDEITGQVGVAPEVKTMDIKGILDVKVKTGTTLPFNKSKKENTAKELFQLQVIDAEELLKQLDYPNYQAVLARMQEQAQMAAQQQAAMAPPVEPV